jgi:hypothetical protein
MNFSELLSTCRTDGIILTGDPKVNWQTSAAKNDNSVLTMNSHHILATPVNSEVDRQYYVRDHTRTLLENSALYGDKVDLKAIQEQFKSTIELNNPALLNFLMRGLLGRSGRQFYVAGYYDRAWGMEPNLEGIRWMRDFIKEGFGSHVKSSTGETIETRILLVGDCRGNNNFGIITTALLENTDISFSTFEVNRNEIGATFN